MRERGAWCRSAKDRRTILSQARSPVEQLLRLLVPGFVGHRIKQTTPFAAIAPSFFDYLEYERGLRHDTRRLYAHHLRVFEAYLRRAGLAVTDVTPAILTEFLGEPGLRGKALGPTAIQQRGGTLRVFFRYLHRQRVVSADFSRAIPRRRGYRQAIRDRALLLTLYNTGARVQEIADLRVEHVSLSAPPHVRLRGKGDKWRTCPLWEETTRLLRRLLDDRHVTDPSAPVFTAASGRPLTRFGIYKLVRRHASDVESPTTAKLPVRRITPHVFRHTAAVHLLEAGVEVNVIRGWLGHVSLETTNRYAEITVGMKEAAMKLCEPATAGVPARKPAWCDDAALLTWLSSL
ncbi:MAG: tyrosine-type recombinase/integrase [Acidobacteriota bacterium]